MVQYNLSTYQYDMKIHLPFINQLHVHKCTLRLTKIISFICKSMYIEVNLRSSYMYLNISIVYTLFYCILSMIMHKFGKLTNADKMYKSARKHLLIILQYSSIMLYFFFITNRRDITNTKHVEFMFQFTKDALLVPQK